MKKYCLKKSAKKEIINFLMILGSSASIIALAVGFITFPFALIYAGTNNYNNFTMIFGYIGILSWTIFISAATIQLKEWVISSFEECEPIK